MWWTIMFKLLAAGFDWPAARKLMRAPKELDEMRAEVERNRSRNA